MRAALVVALGLGLAACPAKPSAAPAPVVETATVPPTVPWPRTPFDDALAELPEPNADAAFVFDGDVDYGVAEKRRLRITAEPGEFDGKRAWFVDVEEGTPASSDHVTTWLSRDLRLLRRDLVKSGGDRVTTVVSSDEATETSTSAGGAPITRPHDRRLTLAAALLFFRMCPAVATADGGEATQFPCVWNVDPDGGLGCAAMTNDLADARITLSGPERTPTLIETYVGDHHFLTIRPRAAAPK